MAALATGWRILVGRAKPCRRATQWSAAATQFFAEPTVHLFDEQTLGACHMVRVLHLPEDVTLAEAKTDRRPHSLRAATLGPAQVGAPLQLVLYWQAETPVAASYTVFTQLFDPAGAMVAQQDNLPVTGLGAD